MCLAKVEPTFYTPQQLSQLALYPVPKHVAIIMDGNRRWEKKHPFSSVAFKGHWAGAKILLDIVQAAKELEISILTVFGFSTENWRRPPNEVTILIEILTNYLRENRALMVEKGVKLEVIGDILAFPHFLQKEIALSKEATKNEKEITLVLALNYGARAELTRACQKLAEQVKKGEIEEITENTLQACLETAPFGDPDLLIRTSGERRVSNFLLWQLAYAEIYVTDVLWPDFSPAELMKAVVDFQKRVRRMGQ